MGRSSDLLYIDVTVCERPASNIREAVPNRNSLLAGSVLYPCHRMIIAHGLFHETQAMFGDAIFSATDRIPFLKIKHVLSLEPVGCSAQRLLAALQLI